MNSGVALVKGIFSLLYGSILANLLAFDFRIFLNSLISLIFFLLFQRLIYLIE